MNNILDRMSGLFFLLFALIVYFYLIPTQVEAVDYGALRPKTLPQILSVVIGLFSLMLLIKPTNGGSEEAAMPWINSALIFGVLMIGLWGISQFGFIYIAPLLVLVLIIIMGERRPFWLIGGVVGIPLTIWFCVEFLLGRPLP